MKVDVNSTAKNTLIKYGAIAVGVAVLGTVAYFVVLKPTLEFFGLKDSKADKQSQRETERQKASGIWDKNYYQSKQNQLTLNATEADAISKNLKGSIDGWFSMEDESGIYNQFKNLKTKADLSFVASKYDRMYGKDLLTELIDDLNSEELLEVYKITDKLQ